MSGKQLETWTKEDEEALCLLNAKKHRVAMSYRRRVEDVVDRLYYNGMSDTNLVDALIEHRTAILDCLTNYVDIHV